MPQTLRWRACRPSGASDLVVEATAARLEKLLPLGDAAAMLRVAPTLLAELLDAGDDLAAWILCGGPGSPLSLSYRGVPWASVGGQTAFVQVMADAARKAKAPPADASRLDGVSSGQNASGGQTLERAALLQVVIGGGSGTLRGVIDVTRWAVLDWRQQLTAWANQLDLNRYNYPR
jgi:hypothetical protein